MSSSAASSLSTLRSLASASTPTTCTSNVSFLVVASSSARRIAWKMVRASWKTRGTSDHSGTYRVRLGCGSHVQKHVRHNGRAQAFRLQLQTLLLASHTPVDV